MKMRKLDTLGFAFAAWGLGGALVIACSDDGPASAEDTTGTPAPPTSSTSTADDAADTTTGVKLDLEGSAGETAQVPQCATDGACDLIDLLFVIDNSGTMGEEQLNLANNFQQLVDQLQDLKDSEGNNVNPNVNIMVTTSDIGHPLCTLYQKPDYVPRKGAPVYQGCNSRIQRFTGLDTMDPLVVEEACTANCPVDIAPGDQFINFSISGSNVPNDDVGAALSCIGPQGIDGCGYEAPLEAMAQALNEGTCWNNPDQEKCDDAPEWVDTSRGFLRDDAVLAIALITDEMDCSATQAGYSFFTDAGNPIYWNVNPTQEIPLASSAVCFNAGVTCTDVEGDGVYEGCESIPNPDALQPVERYTKLLNYFKEDRNKEVIMLGILGVPEVVAHNEDPPYQPIAGGAEDLVYRDWIDFPFPAGDILIDEWDLGVRAADKQWEFGNIGPGCTGTDARGNFTGQAIPPVRIREVCESLNGVNEDGEEEIRCCIESICDTDFSPAIRCLTGVISEAITTPG